MARDLRLQLREAVITYLRANTALIALVPAESIHGERVPSQRTRPYIAMSKLSVEGFEASCINGGRIEIRLNVFTSGADSGPVIKISSTLAEELDDAQLELDDGWCLDITYVRTNQVSGGTETTDWHDVVVFSALTGVGD